MKSNMPAYDGTQHLVSAVESAVRSFVGVPRNIIQAEAEKQAEIYVSSTLGLDDESFTKRVTKDQFIEMFMDKMRWTI